MAAFFPSGTRWAGVLASILMGALLSAPCLGAELLTWSDCVDKTIQGNPDLRAARESLQASEYQLRGAASGFYPQVSANLDITKQGTSGPATSGGSGGASGRTLYETSLTATQNLFAGFQDRGKVEQGRANRDVSQANLDKIGARVGFDLASAFANFVYAQDSLKLADKITRRREENLRLVQLRFEGGYENKGSFLLAKGYLSEARFDRLQAQHNIEVAQAQLARVMGSIDPDEIRVTGDVPTTDPPSNPDYTVLITQTPDHRMAAAQTRSAQAGVKLARSPLFPSLNLSGTAAKDKEEGLPAENRWALGLNLAVPLFSGGKDYFGTKNAVSTLGAAEQSEAGVDRQLLVTLKQAYTNVVQSIEKLNVDQDFLQAATTRAEIARDKYNNGLLSFEDWDIIENDLIAREKTLLQSRRDRIIAWAAWEQALGRGPTA